jgi:hypothetical protein
MLAGIIPYDKSPGEQKIDNCEKNTTGASVVHISQESRVGYSVFSIGWHGERRNI